MDFLTSSLPAIEHFRLLGYWIVLLISLLESLAFVGIAIPGTIFIILVGFVSAKGFLDLGDLIWFAAIGAILGDVLSYYLGRRAKRIFKDGNRIFKSKYLERGKSFFSKYGGRSVFLGRFVGPIRPVIPFIAGMFKMDMKKFLLWNIFSGFAWASAFLLMGFFFGQAWETIALWSTKGGLFITAFIGSIVILYILKVLIAKNGKQVFLFLSSVWRSIKEAVSHNPDMLNLVKKHPVFFKFIRRRLNRNSFWGMPVTLLCLVFIYTLSLFAGIVEDVITADVITSADMRISNLLAVFRGTDLTQFFLWVTLLGKWQIVLSFTVATACILWLWRKRGYIIPLILTIIGSEVFTGLGKIIIRRPRPELAIYPEDSFSFPSGHATIATAFYGFLAYILIRNSIRWKTKINLFFASTVIILLIGFSRLYLGVHYLSDVWGGYLVGLLWLIIGISISEWLRSRKETKTQSPLQTKRRIIPIILVTASLLFYAGFAFNYHPQISQPANTAELVIVQNAQDIFPDEQLKYTETLTGERQEPLSFIIMAKNDEKLTELFTNSGWFLADKVNIYSVAKLAKAALLKQAYPQAPMTPSFWNKQVHNFGFEKPAQSNNARQRHHARFWKTNLKTPNNMHVYVGTASFDSGIKWLVTHKISPDIDTERELLFADLQNTGLIASSSKKLFVTPVLGENFSGDAFFTDGNVYLITAK